MNLNKASIYTLFGMCVKLASLLIINKLMASYLTISQYGAFGQYQSTFQITVTIAILGMSTGITKLISKYIKSQKKESIVVNEIKIIILLTSAILMIILSINFKNIFSLTAEFIEYKYINYIIVFTVIALPIAALSNVSSAIYCGKFLIKENTIANSTASILALLIAYPLISIFGLAGAIIVLIIYTISPLLFTFKNTGLLELKIEKRSKINKIVLKSLFGFSIATIFSAIATPLFQIYIRNQLNELKMNELIGIWQGILKISDIAIIIPAAILGNYLLPKLANIKNNTLIIDELKKTLSRIMPIYASWLIFIVLLKHEIVIYLFNEDYLKIIHGLNYQLLGDFIRLPILMITILFLARGKIKKFIFLEIASPGIQIVLFLFSREDVNINRITLNYSISFIITAVVLIGYIYYCNYKKIEWN